MAKKIIHFHSRKYHVTTHDSPGVVCLVIWPKHACCDRNRRERNLAWINIYFFAAWMHVWAEINFSILDKTVFTRQDESVNNIRDEMRRSFHHLD